MPRNSAAASRLVPRSISASLSDAHYSDRTGAGARTSARISSARHVVLHRPSRVTRGRRGHHRIYNEGIRDRVGTFETRERTAADVVQWFDGRHPIVVVENPDGEVVAFASTSWYRPRDCYAGIAEFSVYVSRDGRGHGAGRVAMDALIDARARRRAVEAGVAGVRREHGQPNAARDASASAKWASTRSTRSSTASGATS